MCFKFIFKENLTAVGLQAHILYAGADVGVVFSNGPLRVLC